MDKDKKSDYWELLDKLVDCEQGSEREFAICKELVEISDAEIKATEEDAKADVFDPQTGKLLSEQPIFLDDFAAPMDNLARIYIDREEFDKALPLLEKALPIYRTLEIRNAKYTYQRYYATKAMIDCLRKVGKDILAVLYEYELKHLRRDVLKDENIDKKNNPRIINTKKVITMYERLKQLLDELNEMGKHPFIGYGNPDAKILIIGKECAIQQGSEDWRKFIEPNFRHWLASFEGRGFGFRNGGEPYDFESRNFHPINPFFKLENKRQTKDIKIGRPSATWYNYQRLIDQIRERKKSDIVNFFDDCFITELNDICRPNDNNLTKIERDEIRQHIQERFDWMRKTHFFKQFKVVILACGPYADAIKKDAILEKDLFGDAKVFYSKQLSFWDKKLEEQVPTIHNILYQ